MFYATREMEPWLASVDSSGEVAFLQEIMMKISVCNQYEQLIWDFELQLNARQIFLGKILESYSSF